ncbi:cilium assembly protein DZIP1L [Elgaria multicarinata webbii]|uniref:cilium assembly protein DZIP1L n=1 Tax=Elgaria multicarinata webbii TaxID=159646 RepID=UPI002FCD0ADE
MTPFVSNIYYPLPQPASRHCWTGLPGSTFPVNFQSSGNQFGNMLASPGVIPAFKFQPRRDTIDWRRFSAIDVERVARELDLATLQESINGVTFCNLDAEKCPYCQQPVDPVLLKVLKMAQLIIEYLLHSQECLSMSLALQEEQHQGALEDLKQLKRDLDKQAEELKCVKEECRRRKKMIASQQLLLQAGANNYHKCQLCDKTFMNYSFLQAHMQRRHPEATAAEKEKKKQVEQMESEIEELKVKLKETHAQLENDSQYRVQEAKNIRQRDEEERKTFERWKEEERTKFQKEMEDLRHLFLTELKDISSKNSVLEGKLQELQVKNVVVSNLGTLQDDDSVNKRQWNKAQRELQGMKAKIEQQKTEWKWKLSELQKEYQMEKEGLKGENERLRASLSSDQWKMAEHSKQQMASLTAQLREQAKIIQSQEKTIKLLSSSKAREIQEVPKAESPEESTEEELDDTLDRKKRILEALRRDPHLLRQFRPILEETLEEKLEKMGVKRGTKGIPVQTYKKLRDGIKMQQQQKANTFPHFLALRDKLEQEVKKRVSWGQKNERDESLQFSVISGNNQMSPPSPIQVASSKHGKQQVELQPYASEGPKPAPRSKVSSMATSMETPRLPSPKQARRSPTSPQHSAVHHPSTSPFSSEEEESEKESSFTSPKLTPLKRKPESPRVAQIEVSEWDSSDIDSPEEKGSSGMVLSTAATTRSETLVQSMAKNLERTLSAPRRKPPGGVKLFSTQTEKVPTLSHSTKKLQFVEQEDSDLEISSLEEVSRHLDTESKLKKQQDARSSRDLPGAQGTGIWSFSSPRGGAW